MYYEFKTKPQTVDFSLDSKKVSDGSKEYNDTLSISCSPLKWTCSADIREWGINGLSILIPDQEIEVDLTVEFWSDDNDEGYEKDINIKINLSNIEIAREINHINAITLTEVELKLTDLKKIDDYNYVAEGTASVEFTYNNEY